MAIIKTHDIYLYGGNSEHKIVLKPLHDSRLEYLYKWYADPEVLYWTESGRDDAPISYSEETVRKIYSGVSQNAFCFLVEADGKAVGDCWLQKMNLPEVIEMYPKSTDIRRIDMAIGEKEYWGKGIGSLFVGMLIDFAFNSEKADVIHCFCEDYNIKSRRVWEKNNFSLAMEKKLPEGLKGKREYHYRLTRQSFIERKRFPVSKDKVFCLPVNSLQPTQLYISEGKLRLALEWFDTSDILKMDPVPVKKHMGKTIMTDGHTRAVLALKHGFSEIPCYWDTDDLDMLAYAKDIEWCEEEGICCASDLTERVVSHKDFEVLWRKRCMMG